MRGSILLGRLGNTEIGVHVTFLPVLAWAAWLGAFQYGGINGAAFGLFAVSLLFGCVLVHELAHGLYARTLAIEVPYIVLLPVGGLANLDISGSPPQTEAKIALIGPAANLVLGALLGLLALQMTSVNTMSMGALIGHSLSTPSLLGLIVYLSVANFGLAFFNLLPAFPLDGGRALRAILSLHMPYESATRAAAIMGRSFGAGMAAVGLCLILLGELYYGVALLLVAVIVYGGATDEMRLSERYAALQRWTVEQVLREAEHTAAPYDPLVSVLSQVVQGIVVPVTIGSRLVGLVTPSDVSAQVAGKTVPDLSVAHIMRTRFPTVRLNDPLWVAYEKLKRSRLDAIPVVSQGSLSGLITLADVRRALRNRPPDAQ